MTDYRRYATPEIINASLMELNFIAERFGARTDGEGGPKVILIGGWAVDVYNPWYGSIDIDLVTTSRLRESIEHTLLHERNFIGSRKGDGTPLVIKKMSYGRNIIIDFMVKERDERFEGTEATMRYSLLNGRTVEKTGRANVKVHVPNRAALTFLKTKAAWDRDHRVVSGTSLDAEWERGKIEKDHADILALLDPRSGGRELDLNEFAGLAAPYPFLKRTIEQIENDTAAIARYGRMTDAEAKAVLDILLRAAWPG